MALGAATRLQSWFLSQNHFDSAFISRNGFFQEVMSPLGIRWMAGSRLWKTDGVTACLAFHRAIDAPPFTKTEQLRLKALTFHLSQATRVHRKLMTQTLEAKLCVAATDSLTFGIAVVDADGRVLFLNKAAESLLSLQSVFKPTSAHRIRLYHCESQAMAYRAIASAIQLKGTSLHFLDSKGEPTINAVFTPLPAASQWNLNWQRPLALLSMVELQRSKSISTALLYESFKLTQAESDLTNWIMSGRRVDQYAEVRGVSKHTVRTQLKSVLSKTDTHSQSQLIASLAQLSALQS